MAPRYQVCILDRENGKQEIIEGDDALVQVTHDLPDGGQKWSFISHVRTSTLASLLAKVDINALLDRLNVPSLFKGFILARLGGK